MGTKIYVGNMNYRTTEDGLRNLFSNYGNVLSVKIVMDRETEKPRGFAFVEMENDNDANSAIAALDKQELDGRMLRVNKANDRREGGERRDNGYAPRSGYGRRDEY